jgi:hypothetical protein
MATFGMRTIGALAILLLTFASTASAQTQLPPDDCSWSSVSEQPRSVQPARGPSRKALKLRTADAGKSYTKYNHGKPITIDKWFTFTCGLDALVPKELPADKPIEGAETMRVTLRGYLLSARFMRDGDHDIGVELGARKALWELVRKDGCKEDQCILKKPVEILVTGYVLIGNPPQGVTDYCHAATGRGMHKGDQQQGHVRGLWRLQPVLSVKRK